MRCRRSKKDPAAAIALADAKQTLDRVKSREDEVRKVAKASREFRHKNHFAEQLSALFEAAPRSGRGHT